MPTSIDFYFDFISPYGYFAAERIDALGVRHGRSVRWRAFNMRSVNFHHLGVDKPLFQAPLKGPYFQQDVPRTARWFGLPYAPGSVLDFNPLAAMRAFWWLCESDAALATSFAKAVFRTFFVEGQEPNTPDAVAAIVAPMAPHLDLDTLRAHLDSPAARDRLKLETQAAVDAGVWGTPTFIVDGQMFWGADRLAMLDDWLTRGGW
ncbi:MAG: 2-hydroxychromene-2-carboxylate isomerase [Caulobacterales bacterium]